MALSIQDLQNMIRYEVGAGLTGLPEPVTAKILDKVTPHLPVFWEAWTGKAYYPYLQKEYVKRQCLLVLIGQHRDLIPSTIEGGNVQQEKLFENLQEMYKACGEEIKRLEEEYANNRQPALGTIATPVAMDAQGRLFNPLAPGRVSTWPRW